MMSANSSGRVSRPLVLMLIWTCCSLGDRRGADAAERGLDVLALHRRDDVVRRQIELGQPVGVEPDPQRIIERPEQRDLADALDPRQRVDDVDGRVIAQIDGVVGVLRRIDIDDLKQRRRFLADASGRHATPRRAVAAVARLARFCTLTVLMSGSVPSAKVTLSV